MTAPVLPTVFARLADPSHRLPLPGVPGAEFPAEGRVIETTDPFWSACLADGSLIVVDPAPAVDAVDLSH